MSRTDFKRFKGPEHPVHLIIDCTWRWFRNYELLVVQDSLLSPEGQSLQRVQVHYESHKQYKLYC